MIDLITNMPKESRIFLISLSLFILTYRCIGHYILHKYPDAFDKRHAMGVGFAISWHVIFYGMIAFFVINHCS